MAVRAAPIIRQLLLIPYRNRCVQMAMNNRSARAKGAVIFVKYSALRVIVLSEKRLLRKGNKVPARIKNVNSNISQLLRTINLWLFPIMVSVLIFLLLYLNISNIAAIIHIRAIRTMNKIPSPGSGNAWTLETNPYRVRNVPKIHKLKVTRLKTINQISIDVFRR